MDLRIFEFPSRQFATPEFDTKLNNIAPTNTPNSQEFVIGSHPTPATLVLQHAFANFVTAAKTKIKALLTKDLEKDNVDLMSIFENSLDPPFDAVLSLIGALASQQPKLIVDSIMVWRKSNNDSLVDPDELLTGPLKEEFLTKRGLKMKQVEFLIRERRSILSNFVLCRVLGKILKNLTKETLPDELGIKIEDMIFGQFKNADPDIVGRYANRMANVEVFSQLAGNLAELRFLSVTDRYLTEINKQPTIKESRVEMLIRSMGYIKLKIFPMDELEATASFLKLCAESFLESHITKIKHAFAQTFVDMFEPIAAVVSAEVNLPMWIKIIDVIYPKAIKMMMKPRHFCVAIPLITTLLCISRKDFFLKNWLSYCDILIQKFREKDKTVRTLAVSSLVRLTWIYLHRHPENLNSLSHKRLDALIKNLFPPGRKLVLPTDVDYDLHMRIVYFICNKFPEFGTETILPYLLGYSQSSTMHSTTSIFGMDEESATAMSTTPLPIHNLTSQATPISSSASLNDPIAPCERYTIALRSFKLFIFDALNLLSKSSKSTNGLEVMEGKFIFPRPPFPCYSDTSVYQLCELSDKIDSYFISESVYGKLSLSIRNTWDRVNDVMGTLGSIIDTFFSKYSFIDIIQSQQCSTNGNVVNSSGSRRSSFSDPASLSVRAKNLAIAQPESNSVPDRIIMIELFNSWLALIPVCTPSTLKPREVIIFITKYIFSGNFVIKNNAIMALERLVQFPLRESEFWSREGLDSAKVIDIVVDTGFKLIEDNMYDIFSNTGVNPEETLVNVYIRLIELWCVETNLDFCTRYKIFIQKMEGFGLLFLASKNEIVRIGGLKILEKSFLLEGSVENYGKHDLPNDGNSCIASLIVQKSSINIPFQDVEGLKLGNSRIFMILKKGGQDLLKRHYAEPSLSPNATNDVDKEKKNIATEDPNGIFLIAKSGELSDFQIWRRCFPDLSRWFFEYAEPASLIFCLKHLFVLVQNMAPSILAGADSLARNNTGTVKWSATDRLHYNNRLIITATDEFVEQWRLYIILACGISGVMVQRGLINEIEIKNIQKATKNIYVTLMELLSCERALVRQSAVVALSCVHTCNYDILLMQINPFLQSNIDDMKVRLLAKNEPRKTTNNNSMKKFERQRMELVHILSFVADFVNIYEYRNDTTIVLSITTFMKQLARYLSAPEIQNEWGHQILRYYFCGFVQRFYTNLVNSTSKDCTGTTQRTEVESVMSFELRLCLFKLFEIWCGYGSLANSTRERETKMMNYVLDQIKDVRERASLNVIMEEQRKALELASLKAMAALCDGELSHPSTPTLLFNYVGMVTWIASIFLSPDSNIHSLAEMALKAMIRSNPDNYDLWESVLNRCYTERTDSAISIGFFKVLSDCFCKNLPNPISISQLYVLALFKIGDSNFVTREYGSKLVHYLDNLDIDTVASADETDVAKFEIEIPEKPPLVFHQERSYEKPLLKGDILLISSHISYIYHSAQLSISKRWSKKMIDLTMMILSDTIEKLDIIMSSSNIQGISCMLKCLAPWIYNINLSTMHNLSKSQSHMCLANLFYLTIRFGNEFLSQMEDIWRQLLCQGDVELNLEIIFEYLLITCVRKRNPRTITHSKYVILYLTSMETSSSIMDQIIDKITPVNSITSDKSSVGLINDPIDTILADMPTRPPFSITQIAMIFCVDCILQVPPICIIPHLPTLLHAAIIHLDHYSVFVVEESKSLLRNLIDALMPDNNHNINLEKLWTSDHLLLNQIPLKSVVDDCLSIFNIVDMNHIWGNVSIYWGLECPVLHIACRSLQVYRCISPEFDKRNLAQVLGRCSSLMGDSAKEIQGYTVECLLTLLHMADYIDQDIYILWWAGLACMYSPHESEYEIGIDLILKLISKLDLLDNRVVETLTANKPIYWKGEIFSALLRGLRFRSLNSKCLRMLNILVKIPFKDMILGQIDKKMMFITLANLPNMMFAFQNVESRAEIHQTANGLGELLKSKYDVLSRLLVAYSQNKFRSRDDFIGQFWNLMMDYFSEKTEIIIEFLFSLLVKNDDETREILLEILLSLIRVIGVKKFSELGKRESFWSPLVLLLGNFYSETLIKVLDLTMSGGISSTDTELRLVFGNKSLHEIKREIKNQEPEEILEYQRNCRHNFSQICHGKFSKGSKESQIRKLKKLEREKNIEIAKGKCDSSDEKSLVRRELEELIGFFQGA